MAIELTCSVTLIDAELECDEDSEDASEPDEEDTATGTWWFSPWDGAAVASGAELSCTDDHLAGAAAVTAVSEAELVIEVVLSVDIGSQKICFVFFLFSFLKVN